jgi:hypothetical protein
MVQVGVAFVAAALYRFGPMNWRFLVIVLVFAWGASSAVAQTTEPDTQPTAPHVAEIPPGYHVLTVGTRQIICQPGDDDWVRKAAESVKPATRPSTMPSDIEAAIAQHRPELEAMVEADLGLTDPKPLDDVLDQNLTPELLKFDSFKPNVYFFPIEREKLMQLMENGWTDPRYHYLRFAQQVDYNDNVAISIDRPMDDLVMWVDVHRTDTPAERGDALVTEIADFETKFPNAVGLFAQSGTRNVLSDFVLRKVMEPIKFAPTEEWFPHSAAELFGIKYATFLTGSSRRGLIWALLRGDPRNPLDWPPLDLVNPLDPTTMWPDYQKVYNNAVMRKGAFVIDAWMTKGGDSVFAKTLPALRATPPQNAADLIKTIQEATGIDLTPVMAPFYANPPPHL